MNKLGFGFLRMKLKDDQVDLDVLNPMVDAYMAAGRNYFDTAYTYLDGKSEQAIREAVVNRYPRDRFVLADKLPGYKCTCHEDCYRMFDEQLERCGVSYFDIYLLHWLNEKHYTIAEEHREFEFLKNIKAAGKAKKIGFSFHDTADLLDRILTGHPEVDYVQLQINYRDWESAGIQSRLCYETAMKHGKTIVVMEPVRGGALANVPEEARKQLDRIDSNASSASLALRFVQSLPGVKVVLSGMNTMEQMMDNLQDITPMTEEEFQIMQQAADALNSAMAVPCTGCSYCVSHCPQSIPIPAYFKLFNEGSRDPKHAWKLKPAYELFHKTNGKASDCIACRSCEANCPQKILISEHMEKVAEMFEKA